MTNGFMKIYEAFSPRPKRGFYQYGDMGSAEEQEELWQILSDLSGVDLKKSQFRFTKMLDDVDCYSDKHCFYSYMGKPVSMLSMQQYRAIYTGLTDKQTAKPIYVCFEKQGFDKRGEPVFRPVPHIYDLEKFQSWIKTNIKTYSLGKSGIVFRSVEQEDGTISTGKEEALKFLKNIADKALPEPWKYKEDTSNHPKTEYPILQNYLEYIFQFLKDHGKLARCGQKIGFNTNLLSYFFEPICVVVDKEGEDLFVNPRVVSGEFEAKKMGFTQYPFEEPHFFDNIDDVVYQPSCKIYGDDNGDLIEHISNFEHLSRLSNEPYKNENSKEGVIDPRQRELIRKIILAAFEDAKKMASRNYHFIVPQYRNEDNQWRIQFLMPLYFAGYKDVPDCILVLNPEEIKQADGQVEKCYVIKTLLSFEQAYRNARLLTKPDNTWLNPANVTAAEAQREEEKESA